MAGEDTHITGNSSDVDLGNRDILVKGLILMMAKKTGQRESIDGGRGGRCCFPGELMRFFDKSSSAF